MGLSTSKKSVAMEHQETIASSSGIVSKEIKRSVNTDYGKYATITDQRKSAFGLNLGVAKDGVGAGLQANNTGVEFFASKEKIGGHEQCGNNGFALKLLQNGENTIDLGLSKEQLDINVKSEDSAIGTSFGKRGISGSVEHKNFAMAGFLSKESKLIQMSAGEFNAGLLRGKHSVTGEKTTRETGEKVTSATVQVADVKLADATWKHSKSLDFDAGDVKTGFKRQINSQTGETSTSATVQVANVNLAGATWKHSKSLNFAAGDVKIGFKQEKKSETGEMATSATVQVNRIIGA